MALTSGWKHRDAVVLKDQGAERTTPHGFFLLLNHRQTNPTQYRSLSTLLKIGLTLLMGIVELRATLKSGFVSARAFQTT